MFFKFPKNDANFYWTQNAALLMRKYNLSESKVRRVIGNFERKELGIAPGTIAVAQRAGSAKNQYEIWVMYENEKQRSKHKAQKTILRKKIVAAWKYPGQAPRGKLIEAPLA